MESLDITNCQLSPNYVTNSMFQLQISRGFFFHCGARQSDPQVYVGEQGDKISQVNFSYALPYINTYNYGSSILGEEQTDQ